MSSGPESSNKPDDATPAQNGQGGNAAASDSAASAQHSSAGEAQAPTVKTPAPDKPANAITNEDYRSLAAFRYALRQFLVFSEGAALAAGLMPQQHQALLAIKDLSLDGLPSVGDIAERLVLRHHSVVELISRMARMGLVERLSDPEDGRRVRVMLTPLAQEKLADLSATHLAELRSIRPLLTQLLQHFQEHDIS